MDHVADRVVGQPAVQGFDEIGGHEVAHAQNQSIAPIRQPRLLPPTPDEAWPEDVWDTLPTELQRDALHVLARLLIRWCAQLERRP